MGKAKSSMESEQDFVERIISRRGGLTKRAYTQMINGARRDLKQLRADAEPRDPMNVEAALRAVEGEVLKLTLEVGFHLQELEAEHLRVDGDRVIASTGSGRLVHELVGLSRLLGQGPNGVLK